MYKTFIIKQFILILFQFLMHEGINTLAKIAMISSRATFIKF
jgi:hypothetical protein